MRENINFAFVIGYLAGLKEKLLNSSNIEKLRSCSSLYEFKNMLKSFNYEVSEFDNFNDFDIELYNYFNETVESLKGICPKDTDFFFFFCKNDFLNFKSLIKHKFLNSSFTPSLINPYSISPKDIKKCIECDNFEIINSPFKEAFAECFKIFNTTESKKAAEIFIDKKMYEVMLQIANKNCFLLERTKLEIDLKNINYCIRYAKYNEDIKNLNLFMLEGGQIGKPELIEAIRKSEKEIYNIFKNVYYINNKNIDENFFLNNSAFEDILQKFDESYIYYNFSFIPVFIYINSLQRQIKLIKEIAVYIIFKK